MQFDRLQREVGQWARQNFGDQPPSYALVGASEEIGELSEEYLQLYMQATHSPGIQDRIRLALELQAAVGRLNHSILKSIQGIRQDEPDVGPNAEAEFIEQIRMNLRHLEKTPPEEGREVKLDALPDPSEDLIDAVADTSIYLADFSSRAGVDLNAAVTKTWEDVVSERDWNSDLGGDA